MGFGFPARRSARGRRGSVACHGRPAACWSSSSCRKTSYTHCSCCIYRNSNILTYHPSRVAELEQENARLQALAQQPQSQGTQASTPVDTGLLSEVEQLRRQLAETQKRERELAAKLSSVPEREPSPVRQADVVKVEAVEPVLPASLRAHKGERSGASFGLMVRMFLTLGRSHSPDTPARFCSVLCLRSFRCPRITPCQTACLTTLRRHTRTRTPRRWIWLRSR